MALAPVHPRRWVQRALVAVVVIVFAMAAIFIVFTPVETVSKVRVAIIDGGIDPTYPALNKAKIEVRSVPGAPSRVSEHGSAMAAIMVESASAKPSTRSPTIEIVDVPALDVSGVGEVEDLATGITTATQQDVDMIVAALGTEMDVPELKEAVRQAQNDGVTIFSAAGNGIGDFASYPAQYEGVISVGALNKSGRRLRFTNTRATNLLASGEEIRVESPGGGAQPYSGTSPATAIAAGKIAACWPLIAPHTLDQTRRNTPVDQAIEESIEEQGKDPREFKSL